jgi:hypothetical protein
LIHKVVPQPSNVWQKTSSVNPVSEHSASNPVVGTL